MKTHGDDVDVQLCGMLLLERAAHNGRHLGVCWHVPRCRSPEAISLPPLAERDKVAQVPESVTATLSGLSACGDDVELTRTALQTLASFAQHGGPLPCRVVAVPSSLVSLTPARPVPPQ